MSIKAKYIALLFLLFLGSLSELSANSNHAVVLMYHRFGENKYPSTNIRIEQFIQQLDYLEKHQYKVWPLPRLVKHLTDRQAIPEKVVAITVDDAYLSVYTVAYPILKQRNLPFAVFVATDPVDNKYSNYMSWEQLRDLADNGVTLGNHSRTHAHLFEKQQNENDRQWRARILSEVQYAENRIKEKTGIKTTLFAYPYGEYSLALSSYLLELSYIGFGQQSGSIDKNSDLGYLPRFPISEHYADISEFAQKLQTLPLPLVSIEPLEPVTKLGNPLMTLTLAFAPQNKQDLQCYVSGQGKANMEWLSATQFRVTAKEAITTRRSRYNCTLRESTIGSYYWYSHLWIRPDLPER